MQVDQLTLNVSLKDEATFDNFYTFDNQEVVTCLKQMFCTDGQNFVYLWGEQSVGRTHLLQASCQKVIQEGLSAIYIPLKNYPDMSFQIFENIENFFLVCIDDIEAIGGNREWEEAIFHFYNRAKMRGTKMLISGLYPPKELAMTLLDLTSRLSSGVIYHLKALTDSQKLTVLQLQGKARGLNLSEEVGNYLLHHFPRDMTALLSTLDRLDQASLKAKHRLTVPFVKTVLSK